MNDETLVYKIKEANITTVDIINKLLETEIITPELFPHLFDGDTFIMTLDTDNVEKGYHTFCPEPVKIHGEQENGDSCYITEHRVTCFGGCGTVNSFQLAVYFISKKVSIEAERDKKTNKKDRLAISLEAARDKETNEAERLAAKIFFAGNFPKLGIDPKSLANPEEYKWDKKKQVLQAAADYYHYVGTKTKNNKDKLKNFYLETRWLKHSKKSYEELLEECMLGITPKRMYDEKTKKSSYNKLYHFLSKTKGFADKDIIDSGVCIRTESGEIIDFFRNHAIIPYFYKREVIGMYGRSLDPNCPKSKRHLRLSGTVEIPSSLDDILKSQTFFVCEGEITKIAIKACGFDNVMESRGSNGLKDPHFNLLEKHRSFNPEICETVYLVFDPDEAGRKATQKVGRKMLEKGINVMVVRIPPMRVKQNVDGEIKETVVYPDVNDLFKYHGEKAPEVFQSYVDKAISFDAFNLLYNLEKEKITGLAEGRMALKRNAKYLNGIPRLERFFIVAEIEDYLYPAFETKGLSREAFKRVLEDLWINVPDINSNESTPFQSDTTSIEVESNEKETAPAQPTRIEGKTPSQDIEGLETYKEYLKKGLRNPFILLTKDEEFYKKYKPSTLNLVLVRDTQLLEQRIRKASENRKFTLTFDQTFDIEEKVAFLDLKNVKVNQTTMIELADGKIAGTGLVEVKSIA